MKTTEALNEVEKRRRKRTPRVLVANRGSLKPLCGRRGSRSMSNQNTLNLSTRGSHAAGDPHPRRH